jgi:hypothetical protein
MWQDNGTSLVRTGKFRITQKLTVERIEYRVGPAVIYPIHRTPTAIVVDLTNGIYRLRDPTTKELYTLNTIIMNAVSLLSRNYRSLESDFLILGQ